MQALCITILTGSLSLLQGESTEEQAPDPGPEIAEPSHVDIEGN